MERPQCLAGPARLWAERKGDVSYCLYPFDFLPMMLQFWNSDEEFPANLKIMWDENVLDYVRYETTFFIVSHMLSCIKERMDAESVQT